MSLDQAQAMTIDRMEFHEDRSDYPEDVAWVKAGVPAGLFIVWCHKKGLLSTRTQSSYQQEFFMIENGYLNAEQFFSRSFDGKLSTKYLNNKGKAFARYYYTESLYMQDLRDIFKDEGGVYRIEGNYISQERVNEKIDQRFKEWQSK